MGGGVGRGLSADAGVVPICSAGGPVGGEECSSHAAPSTGPGCMTAAVDAFVAMAAITVLAALRRNDRSNLCTIGCCLSLQVAGSIAASRRTMASAVSCGSAPALDLRQIRIELRGHPHLFLVPTLRPAMCGAHPPPCRARAQTMDQPALRRSHIGQRRSLIHKPPTANVQLARSLTFALFSDHRRPAGRRRKYHEAEF
jgi:hypothetical protein